MITRVVLALDNGKLREELQKGLTRSGVLVEPLEGRSLFWDHISSESGDLIIVSRSLVPSPEKIGVLQELPESPWIVMILDKPDPAEEAAFVAAGCDAVMSETLDPEQIIDAVSAVINKRARILNEEITNRKLVGAEPRLSDFVSQSPAMHTFMKVVSRVTASNVSLLILGETGVGKERLARAIHVEGTRQTGPFVAVNCGALPDSLLESELFGHERGAFTGAVRARRGWFEMAHQGTIFLDEIGELKPHLQVKLLRVLQEHEIQRIGSEETVNVDVRIIAATNRDLSADIESGMFRKDLFYRLGVVTLTIPPLRERKEDIKELVENYISYFSSRTASNVTGISDEALEALEDYPWPGNVRELMNVIERGVILCDGDTISIDDIPDGMSGLDSRQQGKIQSYEFTPGSVPSELLSKPLKEARTHITGSFEKAYLSAHLEATGGKVAKTAKLAGIEPRSLYDKMKAHGLTKEEFRGKS